MLQLLQATVSLSLALQLTFVLHQAIPVPHPSTLYTLTPALILGEETQGTSETAAQVFGSLMLSNTSTISSYPIVAIILIHYY
jgi:hypothetical protein